MKHPVNITLYFIVCNQNLKLTYITLSGTICSNVWQLIVHPTPLRSQEYIFSNIKSEIFKVVPPVNIILYLVTRYRKVLKNPYISLNVFIFFLL